ncbi:reverse transcriptase domain-containing protein [Tanacetum coccineum]
MGMRAATIEQLTTQRVADALLAYEANQNSGNGNDNGNGSHDSGGGSGRLLHTARGCTYKDFLNCQPLNFKGTKGAVGLAHWFEKMESVFYINNCIVKCQVKYDTCTLLGGVLTWWNSHVRTVRDDAAYEMTWKSLMKMMIEVHCPRNEIRKLENKLWNLTVKGECPELKNRNRRNQAGSSEARGRVYALGGGETDQDPSNIADDINA